MISFRFLPHEDEWAAAIGEMSRLAKKVIIVDYPDIRSFNIFYSIMFKMKKAYESNTREFLTFNRKSIKNEFCKNGFCQLIFKPQFFFPMVIHRALKSGVISSLLEAFPKIIGLNKLFGTPIIVKASKN